MVCLSIISAYLTNMTSPAWGRKVKKGLGGGALGGVEISFSCCELINVAMITNTFGTTQDE